MDACVALAAGRGWNPEPRKWSLLMRLGEVYGIGEGELIGTVAVTRYGPELSVVSMMIVADGHARRGHGKRLMRHALRVAGRSTVALYATAVSRPLYLGLGFSSVGDSTTYVGVPGLASTGRTRPAAVTDLASVALADRAAYGGDRTLLLRSWLTDHRWLRVAERDGRVVGHAGAWRTTDEMTLIGPVVADDVEAATDLINDLAVDAGGPVRVDVDPGQPGLEAWAIAHGLLRQGPTFPLMVMDGEPLPGDRGRVFAPVGSALG